METGPTFIKGVEFSVNFHESWQLWISAVSSCGNQSASLNLPPCVSPLPAGHCGRARGACGQHLTDFD